jgi:hypothetical protein
MPASGCINAVPARRSKKKGGKTRRFSSLDIHRGIMSGAGTEGKKPRLAEHEAEHIVSIMEMVRV